MTDVGTRVDAVLERVRPLLREGDVAPLAHAHVMRVLTARWLGLRPTDGRLFRMDTGAMSILGFEHERPVLSEWNIRVDR